jgi:hypothetical protein
MNNPKFAKTEPASSIAATDKYTVNASVTDYDRPYSFDAWLLNFGLPGGTPEKQQYNYREYISRWRVHKTSENINTSYKDQYVSYLKQLTYNYIFTGDEKRLAKTTDFDNELEVDISSYIFAKRGKQICEYIRSQRDELKLQPKKTQLRCTTHGVETIIYNDILRYLQDEDTRGAFIDELSELNKVKDELRVQLTELYDVEEGYHGGSLDGNFLEGSDRGKLASNYNSLQFDPYIFIDETQATLNVINKYNVSTTLAIETGDTVTIPLAQSVDSVSDLPLNEFINYEAEASNLTFGETRKLVESTIGVPLNYTITDANANISTSGVLVTPTKPTMNALNRSVASVNIVSNTQTKTKTLQEVGGFFVPNKFGVLTYASESPTYEIKLDSLEADTLYVNPDPAIYSTNNNTHTFTSHPVLPVEYTEKTKWMKATKGSDGYSGDIIDSKKLQKFYNYSSDTDINKHSKFGISRFDDPFDFWTGDESTTWANDDIFKVTKIKDLPLDQRQESLLTNPGQVHRWRTDIYGNEYAMIKDIDDYVIESVPGEECDMSKYQNNIICQVYDGDDMINVLTGLPQYEIGVDGGSDQPTLDISLLIDKLTIAESLSGYDINGSPQAKVWKCSNNTGGPQTCYPGSRWFSDGMLSHVTESGFDSALAYDDFINGGFFLPDLCIESESESGEVATCRIMDGYSIEAGEGYSDIDYYELIGTNYSGFTGQSGDFYNPPFDDIWDAGFFDSICVDSGFESTFKENFSTKYLDESLQFGSTVSESNQPSTKDYSIAESNDLTGLLHVRELSSRYVNKSEDILSHVFSLIPTSTMVNGVELSPRHQMSNHLKDFDVIKDVIILYSENFIYMNKIRYDYDTGHITSDHSSGVLVSYDRSRDVPLKHFFNETSGEILVGVIRRLEESVGDSVVNRVLLPVDMYRVSTNSNTLAPKKLSWSQLENEFLLPANVITTDTSGDGFISYNEQLNYYYLTTGGLLSLTDGGDQFYIYQIRFSLDRDIPTKVSSIRAEFYTSTASSDANTESSQDSNAQLPSIDPTTGHTYYDLESFLNDGYRTEAFDYDTTDEYADSNNKNWINNRLKHMTNPSDHITLADDSFKRLFPEKAIDTFYLKLNIIPSHTLKTPGENDPVYKVEARFHRPDISADHIDTMQVSRKPLPDFSKLNISKLANTDDLTDPRQIPIEYEYNFQHSPQQCTAVGSDGIKNMCPDTPISDNWSMPGHTDWDAGEVHIGTMFKFVVILHTMSGKRYYYPYKFILSPYASNTCLAGVKLLNVSSFVDKEFHESSLILLESNKPRYVAPVVLRTQKLEKITFDSVESQGSQSKITQITSDSSYQAQVLEGNLTYSDISAESAHIQNFIPNIST